MPSAQLPRIHVVPLAQSCLTELVVLTELYKVIMLSAHCFNGIQLIRASLHLDGTQHWWWWCRCTTNIITAADERTPHIWRDALCNANAFKGPCTVEDVRQCNSELGLGRSVNIPVADEAALRGGGG